MLYFFVKSKILLASKTQTTLSPTGKSTTEFVIHFILHSFDMRKWFRCKNSWERLGKIKSQIYLYVMKLIQIYIHYKLHRCTHLDTLEILNCSTLKVIHFYQLFHNAFNTINFCQNLSCQIGMLLTSFSHS